ncbi:MAG: hypothetical protein RSF86_14210, partial [Angelakisella sp.]
LVLTAAMILNMGTPVWAEGAVNTPAGNDLMCTASDGGKAEAIDDCTLKLSNGGDYAISMKTSGITTAQRIIVDAGKSNTANITLTDVKISADCAFEIKSGIVNLTLAGTNTLTSTGSHAGLQQNKDAGLLTIDGTGSLNANGGTLGIGGGQAVVVKSSGGPPIADMEGIDGVDANITINSGVIVANGIGGSDAKSMSIKPEDRPGGAANIIINGGDITSTRASGFDIGGGKYVESTIIMGGCAHYGAANIIITGGTVTCGSYPTGGVADATNINCQIGGGYYEKKNMSLTYVGSDIKVTGGTVMGNCFNGPKRITGDADGDLTIIDNSGARIQMRDNCYYLYDDTYTISGTTTAQRIVVDAGYGKTANITLHTADISSAECAFEIKSGVVNLTLTGTNKLTSTGNYAALQQNDGTGLLTIGGTGSLTANGGTLGIGGGQAVPVKNNGGGSTSATNTYDGTDATITINSGTIVANGIGGSDASSMSQEAKVGGAANITINGGSIRSTGERNFDIGGGKSTGILINDESTHYGTANINITGGTVTCGSYPKGGVADANGESCQIGGGYYIKSTKAYQNCIVTVTNGFVTGNCMNDINRILGGLDIRSSSGQRVYEKNNIFYLASGSYTVSGRTTKAHIVADPGSNETLDITMNGATIDLSGAGGCAFEVTGNGKTTLTLAPNSSNTIKSGQSVAGISATGKDFTITAQDESGKLEVFGGKGVNNCINGNGNGGSGISGGSISGGSITAAGGNAGGGSGILVDDVFIFATSGSGISEGSISGGSVTATGGNGGETGGADGETGNGGSGISGGSISGGSVIATGGSTVLNTCTAGSGISGGSISGGSVIASGGTSKEGRNGTTTANLPQGTPAVPSVYTFSGMANKNVSNLLDSTGKSLKNYLGSAYGEQDIFTDSNGKIYL